MANDNRKPPHRHDPELAEKRVFAIMDKATQLWL